MLQIHIKPEGCRNLALQRHLMTLFARSAAMGVMGAATVTSFEPSAMKQLLKDLGRQGIARSAGIDLAPLLQTAADALDPATAEAMAVSVSRLTDVLDAAPSPPTEWAAMRELIGDELLARLVGTSEVSMRRYASATRQTPQDVAERLHWVAMVVADLMGAYNDFGIRRWFERPRAQLEGQSPREALGQGWSIDGAAAGKVRALAASLTGAQPLAA